MVASLVVAATVLGCTGSEQQNTDPPPVITGPRDLPDHYRIHPSFTLTAGDLRALVAGQPADIRHRIEKRPAVFLEAVKTLLTFPDPILRRVDKEHALPADYVPADLRPLEAYTPPMVLNQGGLSLREIIMPDLLAMVEAARREGLTLDISSSYRSYSYQDQLFSYWVGELGLEEAERVSARPGTSQHQLGTTLDFGSVTQAFAEHPAGLWLAAHAGEFGFSLSYPQGYEELTGYAFEPWHFRWISRTGTYVEAQFFGGIQQRFLEFWQTAEPALRAACTTVS